MEFRFGCRLQGFLERARTDTFHRCSRCALAESGAPAQKYFSFGKKCSSAVTSERSGAKVRSKRRLRAGQILSFFCVDRLQILTELKYLKTTFVLTVCWLNVFFCRTDCFFVRWFQFKFSVPTYLPTTVGVLLKTSL